ncbi:MAG: excinuclease ABC subunit UvrB [Synergistaceae bacterium]|nr:excinuclease ABC subunit UvrB [Synergistaceae bacterium]
MKKDFTLRSEWPPSGDQPEAIEALTKGLIQGDRYQTLLGVTGSGKTFTMANVIANVNRPTLVLAHNKTLAAQLYSEFKLFFPENAVHYFVSYYDYYQPEAYIPSSDTYIEKDASINERIEKLRLAATKALVERHDVLVVASVSCVYGLGKRENYEAAIFPFSEGDRWEHRTFMRHLMENYYERNDQVLAAGKFRVRGDTIEIFPAYDENCVRVTFFDDEIERVDLIHPVTGKIVERIREASIFPAQHYVTQTDSIERSKPLIEAEMEDMVERFTQEGKLLEAQRIRMRTRYDLEMLTEVGYCSGIENYSRYLDGREKDDPPGTLVDFFPDDFLLVVDESHITLPQVRGMFNGDRARKSVLVDNGFRLPSCLDNRPLEWKEFEGKMRSAIFVSATPGDYEVENSSRLVEQVIRPTGVVDPEVEILPATGQVDDLIERLRVVTEKGERALVLTLTKKSSEDLAEYLRELKFKVKYIHSELNTFERAELIRDLRRGDIQALVGINLLREGMDLPEVSLVAILDADREGYLRSHRSLIQIIGRAARNISSKVYLYADNETESIRKSVEETRRRRQKQLDFNERNGIIPRNVEKEITSLLPQELLEAYSLDPTASTASSAEGRAKSTLSTLSSTLSVKDLERVMWEAVEKLDFERAAAIRDIIIGAKKGAKKTPGYAGGKYRTGTETRTGTRTRKPLKGQTS